MHVVPLLTHFLAAPRASNVYPSIPTSTALQHTLHQLQAAAICCILLASKYEEPEEFVPAISELTEYASNTYTPEYIQRLERDVLDRLGWHLTEITPLHFLGYYLLKGVLFTTDRMQGKALVEKVRMLLYQPANTLSSVAPPHSLYAFQSPRRMCLSSGSHSHADATLKRHHARLLI